MKMTHRPLMLAASLAAVLALSACGKKDESTSPIPSSPPPGATVMAPAPAATAATARSGEVAPVSFNALELGSTVDANHRIMAVGTSFAPKDTVYASVETGGSGNATLAAKWSYQDGTVVHEDSKVLDAKGPETTAFMISKPSGFPAGDYKVEIALNGNAMASKDFSVK
jgi:hypothetical protein